MHHIDILEFVKLFLLNIPHEKDETVYICMALIDMYQQIFQFKSLKKNLTFQDITSFITDYICLHLTQRDDGKIIKTKMYPKQSIFQFDRSRPREIDKFPPIVFGDNNMGIKRIKNNLLIADSSRHDNFSIRSAYYAKSIQKIIVLDQLSPRIRFYDLDGKFLFDKKPEKDIKNRNQIIMNIAWSERQKRLGACQKDFSLCFYDADDNFTYEKVINTYKQSNDFQINIFYLGINNYWLTVDDKYTLNIWDLNRDKIQFQLKSEKLKSNVFEVIEMPAVKLIAVGSLDKVITVWNFEKRQLIFTIDDLKGGIHTLRFSQTFNRLIVAGFDNNPRIYRINPTYQDYSFEGNLSGHDQSITALEVIESTPMILTADEIGVLKLWDIRSMKCMQTVKYGRNYSIIKIISMYDQGKICFVGNRLYVIQFEEQIKIKIKQKQKQQEDQSFPTKAIFDSQTHSLIISTHYDIRFLNLQNGQFTQGICDSEEEEITGFNTTSFKNFFVVTNQLGEIKIYNTLTGNLLKSYNEFPSDIKSMKIDYDNNILIAGGRNATVKIFQIEALQKEFLILKREIVNIFNNRKIKLLQISVYHNLLAIAGFHNQIAIYSYEFGKLLGMIDLDQSAEVTNMQFINGISLLIISTNDGYLYFMRIQNAEFQSLAKFDFNLKEGKNWEENSKFTKALISKKVYQEFISEEKIQSILQIKANIQENSDEMNNSNFSKTISKQDSIQQVEKEWDDELLIDNNESNNNDESQEDENSNFNIEFPTFIAVEFNDQYLSPQKSHLNYIFVGTNQGEIYKFSIKNIIDIYELKMEKDCREVINYNPYRSTYEDYTRDVKTIGKAFKLGKKVALKKPISINKLLGKKNIKNNVPQFYKLNQMEYQKKWEGHRDVITDLEVINMREKKLVSCSMDQGVKVWDLNGNLKGHININYPLPINWLLQYDDFRLNTNRFVYALKILDQIQRRYFKQLKLSEENLIVKQVQDFLIDRLLNRDGQEKQQYKEIQKIKKKVQVMQDEYDKKDVQYEKIKSLIKSEVQGLDLIKIEQQLRVYRQMEENEINLECRFKEESSENDNYKKYDNEETLQILAQNYRKTILEKKINPFQKELETLHQTRFQNKNNLEEKIQQYERQKKQQQNINYKTEYSPKNQQLAQFIWKDSLKEGDQFQLKNSSLKYLQTQSNVFKQPQKTMLIINAFVGNDFSSTLANLKNSSSQIPEIKKYNNNRTQSNDQEKSNVKLPDAQNNNNNHNKSLLNTTISEQTLFKLDNINSQSNSSKDPFLQYAVQKNLIKRGSKTEKDLELSKNQQQDSQTQSKQKLIKLQNDSRSKLANIIHSLDKNLKISKTGNAQFWKKKNSDTNISETQDRISRPQETQESANNTYYSRWYQSQSSTYFQNVDNRKNSFSNKKINKATPTKAFFVKQQTHPQSSIQIKLLSNYQNQLKKKKLKFLTSFEKNKQIQQTINTHNL